MSITREYGGHNFETFGAKPLVELQRILVVQQTMLKTGKLKVFLSDLVGSVQSVLWPDGVSRNSAYNGLVTALREGAVIDGEWLISIETKPKETKKLYEKTKLVWLRRGRLEDLKSAGGSDAALRAAAQAVQAALPPELQSVVNLATGGPGLAHLEARIAQIESGMDGFAARIDEIAGGLDHFDKLFENVAIRLNTLEDRA